MPAIKPVYINTAQTGRLAVVVKKAMDALHCCTLCPRKCAVDRLSGETGVCKTGRRAKVSSIGAHFGEESPLVGTYGSGTVFFTHCNLLCSFCQNFDISHGGWGETITDAELADMMLSLQARGCHNINFVTPSHVVPQILAALEIAIAGGLKVPIVFNTGGYDRVETLQMLEGIVDIYMPDFKFWEADLARQTCDAPDYPEVARRAVIEMYRQVGDLFIDDRGIAARGLLLRHLVLPHGLAGTREIMHFIAQGISKNTYVNVMSQYRPMGRAAEIPELAEPLLPAEYRAAIEIARAEGILRLDRP